MLRRARGFRSRIVVFAALLSFALTNAVAQSARERPAAQAQLQGPIHLGHYEPIDTKAHIKLWLGRYASPGLLANADVAYVYDGAAFCGAAGKPKMEDFYTERFAVARADTRGYEVDELLQIKKVSFCKPATVDQSSRFYVITKVPLDKSAPPFVINWAAGGSVGGTTVLAPAPGKAQERPESFNAAPFITSGTDLDTRLLVAYEGALRSHGVWLQELTQVSRLQPMAGPDKVVGLAERNEPRMYLRAPAIVPPVMPLPPAKAGERRYCLYNMQPRRAGSVPDEACSADFSSIATKILAAARERKAAKPAAPARPMPMDLTELPRYVLVVD